MSRWRTRSDPEGGDPGSGAGDGPVCHDRRASVESHSIKKLEPLYGFTRDVELREASGALADFEAWLELGQAGAGGPDAESLLERIQGYNRDGCVSTLRLRDWLETQRSALEAAFGEPIPRPEPGEGEPTESVAQDGEEVARLVARLTEGVPADEAERTEEQHARWLLTRMLGYHRREDKAPWWEYFRCREDLSDLDRIEDRATLGGLEYEGVVARSSGLMCTGTGSRARSTGSRRHSESARRYARHRDPKRLDSGDRNRKERRWGRSKRCGSCSNGCPMTARWRTACTTCMWPMRSSVVRQRQNRVTRSPMQRSASVCIANGCWVPPGSLDYVLT